MMDVKRQDLEDFRRSLAAGPVRRAYRALMSFMLTLRTDLSKTLPGIGSRVCTRGTWT